MKKKVTFEDIVKEIEREGIENVKFIYPMKEKRNLLRVDLNPNEPVPVKCTIWQRETENSLHNELYNFFGEYKMYLKAEDEKYGYEDFYVSDFISLINDGKIQMVKSKH